MEMNYNCVFNFKGQNDLEWQKVQLDHPDHLYMLLPTIVDCENPVINTPARQITDQNGNVLCDFYYSME